MAEEFTKKLVDLPYLGCAMIFLKFDNKQKTQKRADFDFILTKVIHKVLGGKSISFFVC